MIRTAQILCHLRLFSWCVDKPCEKLKKALRADINEELWEELYSTTSRPFPKPKTGRIAVKVINHHGDEVMKIVEVKFDAT
jgi:adenine-specific DNA-methyltransferase